MRLEKIVWVISDNVYLIAEWIYDAIQQNRFIRVTDDKYDLVIQPDESDHQYLEALELYTHKDDGTDIYSTFYEYCDKRRWEIYEDDREACIGQLQAWIGNYLFAN